MPADPWLSIAHSYGYRPFGVSRMQFALPPCAILSYRIIAKGLTHYSFFSGYARDAVVAVNGEPFIGNAPDVKRECAHAQRGSMRFCCGFQMFMPTYADTSPRTRLNFFRWVCKSGHRNPNSIVTCSVLKAILGSGSISMQSVGVRNLNFGVLAGCVCREQRLSHKHSSGYFGIRALRLGMQRPFGY